MLTISDLNRNEDLSSAEMGKVAGGAGESIVAAAGAVLTFSDDVASVASQQGVLDLACCNGTHIKKALIEMSKVTAAKA
jgi:hypothetical protein